MPQTAQIVFRAPAPLAEAFAAVAESNGRTVSAELRWLMTAAIEAEGKRRSGSRPSDAQGAPVSAGRPDGGA